MKKIIKLICMLLLLIMPFAAFAIVVESTESPYKETYLAELDVKIDRLRDTEGKRIIFIGGSSLPFGIRSALIEERLEGWSVVNFGLYATIGTKAMMDMARPYIKEGDIVILSPELSEQTYSLYFNPDALLEATDGISSSLSGIRLDDKVSLFYNYYKYAFNKLELTASGEIPGADEESRVGIYWKDSFDEYGEISAEREYNIMADRGYYDSTMPISVGEELFDTDFIEYVNDYCDYVKECGATVLFGFSPVNRLALDSSLMALGEFQDALGERIDCGFAWDIEDCAIHEGYFYDTNFHLNSAGAEYFTLGVVIKGLQNVLGIEDTSVIELPDIPKIEEDGIKPGTLENGVPFDEYTGGINTDYADRFEYKKVGDFYRIVSVKSEYRDMKECILPSVYDGITVNGIESNAFAGCVYLERVNIGTTYKIFNGHSFNECIELTEIYFFEEDGDSLSVDSEEFLSGCSRDVKLYIPEGSTYMSGYTWGNYHEYFEYFER